MGGVVYHRPTVAARLPRRRLTALAPRVAAPAGADIHVEEDAGRGSDGNPQINGEGAHVDETAVGVGVLALVAGRVYGLVDAYSSAGDYNRALAQRLGPPVFLGLDVAPIVSGPRMAYGPWLTLLLTDAGHPPPSRSATGLPPGSVRNTATSSYKFCRDGPMIRPIA